MRLRGARLAPILFVLLAASLRPAVEAGAHALDPAFLQIEVSADGSARVTWKTSSLNAPGTALRPVLPTRCRELSPPRTVEAATADEGGTSVVEQWTVDCGPGGLVGERIAIDGLGRSRTDALLRLVLGDGGVEQFVLRPREPSVVVPPRPGVLDVCRDYARLGAEHILTGPDHLLFVFGLLLLVPGTRALIQTITAFTLGHSVTLALAVLGVAHVPSRPVELLIALSVLLLATELARGAASATPMRRFPWAVALAFGLLHGFGFAGALREAGLPSGEIPAALVSFNAGVEFGQLAFVFAIIALHRLSRQVAARLPAWADGLPVYAMGSLAAFWCWQRAAALLR